MPNMARWCCCGGCFSSIQATITGIDGTICCVPLGASQSLFVDGVEVDGVYVSSNDPGDNPDSCAYRITLDTAMMKQYSDDSCTTIQNSTFASQEYVVDVDISGGLITRVTIFDVSQITLTSRLFSATGSWSLGDVIANQISSCSTDYGNPSRDFSTAGTVKIELP